jgi:hypothetical protein
MQAWKHRCVGGGAVAGTWLAIGLAVAGPAATATPLVDTVRLIADSADEGNRAPSAQTFRIDQAGTYTIKLTDLMTPSPLAALSVAVANSAGTVASLSGPGAITSKDVPLSVGTYTVQPLASAIGGGAGAFTVTVTPPGGASTIYQNNWPVIAPPAAQPNGQSTLQTGFSPRESGSYLLSVTDRNFPAALSALSLLLLDHATGNPLCSLTLPGTLTSCTVTLTAGQSYDVAVVAQGAGPRLKGLYSLKLIGGTSGSTVALAQTLPVGGLQPAQHFNLAAAATVAVRLSDLRFPAPLVAINALAVQGGDVQQSFSAPGTANLAAAAGEVDLFVDAQADSSVAQGAYSIYATNGGAALLDAMVPVVDAAHVAYSFSRQIAAGGDYQWDLTDFAVPGPLTGLSAVVEQNGAALASATGTSSSIVTGVQTGQVNVLAFTANTAGNSGLFGIDLRGTAAQGTVLETTQGVGAGFQSETATITSATGKYALQFTDLGYPNALGQVWLIATQGKSVVWTASTTGKSVFSVPQAGNLVISVLAQVNSTSHYGLYGMTVAAVPPAPVVTLTPSAGAVTAGDHATLTWSATDAASCTASGGWSGTLPVTGSQDVGALSATSTFSLSCTGDGGQGLASAQVTVSPAPVKSGGGGAIGAEVLALLLGGLALTLKSRARTGSTRTATPPAAAARVGH